MASDLNDSAKKIIKARETQILSFLSRLDNFLFKNVGKIARGIETGDYNALQAARALGGLQESLKSAGLGEQVTEIISIYGDELRDIKDRFKKTTGKPVIYNDIDLETTQALITFDTDVVTNRITGYVDDMKATIMRSVITGNVPNFSDLHDDIGGSLVNNLNTELNTALAGFSRTVNLAKAEDLDIDLFLFAGPDDNVTRDFCAEKVGNIYTREEIESWDNGQGLPADIYLGGYNCRHRLDPVSRELAKELGYAG